MCVCVCVKQKYAPSVFEKYVTTTSLGGKEIKLYLYDTAGKTLYQISSPSRNIHSAFLSQNIIWMDIRGKGQAEPAGHAPSGLIEVFIKSETRKIHDLQAFCCVPF